MNLCFRAVFFACVCVALLASVIYAQEFSANIVANSKEGGMKGSVLVSKDKIRMEMQQAVSIVRIDKKLVWMLLPEQKMYMEMPAEAQNLSMSVEKVPGEISRRFIGAEPVDGRDTEKYEVTYQNQGKAETIYVWLSKDLHFPLKSAALDNSWTVEYTNVKEGPQPQDMFELPAGYKKFEYGATAAEAAGN
jgi:hypothetical protein